MRIHHEEMEYIHAGLTSDNVIEMRGATRDTKDVVAFYISPMAARNLIEELREILKTIPRTESVRD